MSNGLKLTFLIHALVALVIGLPLLIAPGRFVDLVGWMPVEPILARILGAALLALGWGSFRVWQSADKELAAVLIQVEAVFAVLAGVGVLRHLLIANYPVTVWVALLVFAAFAIAWIAFGLKESAFRTR